jgi:DNA-binding NarL/FixJ family response regulator
MPGMNGFELARKIVASAPRTRMIMFTAIDCEPLIKDAQDVGIIKVVANSGEGIVGHLLAAIEDVFQERDARKPLNLLLSPQD